MPEVVKTQNWHFYKGNVEPSSMKGLLVFAGRGNVELTNAVFKYLGVTPSDNKISNFGDGEVSLELVDDVSGKDVIVIQSVCRSGEIGGRSVNDALIEVLLLISALKRASCRSVTCVIPYYAYARQDRKLGGRVPISAADVAHMFTNMGANRVVAIDLHCGQIQGMFPPTVAVDNLGAGPVGAAYYSEKALENPVIVSPDAGGLKRAKDFRKMLEEKGYKGKTGLAVFVKQRAAASQIESMDLVGSVEGSDCILVDDMVDSAGTLCSAAARLKEHGARRIYAFCTHGLFSGPAYERIGKSCIDELLVTNTLPLPVPAEGAAKCPDNIKILDLAPTLAEVIRNVHGNVSLDEIFKPKPRAKM